MSDTARHFFGSAFWGILAPFLWVLLLAVPLWLIRRYAPKTEAWLYSPISSVIRRLAGRMKRERLTAPRRD